MEERKRFSGSTVIITGGAGGIGRALALGFASEGASVAVVDVPSKEATRGIVKRIEEGGGRALYFRCDVSKWEQVKSAVGEIGVRLGDAGVLVNCAGIVSDSLMVSMSVERWREVLDVNLTGAFLFMKAVAEGMILRRRGKIVNISSISGHRGGKGQANYAASKAGLEALTRAAAIELAPRGITVNAVAPGMVATEMSATVRELAGRKLERAIPMRRFARPEDIVGPVLFLASREASYITGQVIDVDGGLGVAVQY